WRPPTELDEPSTEPPLILARIIAIVEVLVCSDFPTQIAIASSFEALGYGLMANGRLRAGYVVGVSLIDAIVLIGLVLFFLRVHGGSARDVLVGSRRPSRDAAYGLTLIPLAFLIALAVLLAPIRFAPWLHTVEQNPLQDLLQSRRDTLLFA